MLYPLGATSAMCKLIPPEALSGEHIKKVLIVIIYRTKVIDSTLMHVGPDVSIQSVLFIEPSAFTCAGGGYPYIHFGHVPVGSKALESRMLV